MTGANDRERDRDIEQKDLNQLAWIMSNDCRISVIRHELTGIFVVAAVVFLPQRPREGQKLHITELSFDCAPERFGTTLSPFYPL
jgi:hypothetical protein